METFVGEVIGNIHIIVYQLDNELKVFDIQSEDEKVLPIIDVIEDTLAKY
ncbi:MAG: hypothetical protein HFJ51_05785 [Clostridia bacterium]|nr:hypothetical protein [Clostridia bacterium]